MIADIVKEVTNSGPDGILSGLSELITSFLQSGITDNVSKIVETYVNIANKLNELNEKLSSNEEVRNSIDTMNRNTSDREINKKLSVTGYRKMTPKYFIPLVISHFKVS